MRMDGSRAAVPFAEVTRGDTVESRHRGHAVVVDGEGRLVAAAGDPGCVAFMRSVAKPFQAMAVVASGAADRFGFGEPDLAVMCASHNGEAGHVATVRGMLDRLGRGEESLACGVHPPTFESLRQAMARAGEAPSPLHNNCSGKHAGLIALALHRGWPVDDYTAADHPLQQALLLSVAGAARVAPGDIPLGTDGCSLPTFALPLDRMATAYAALADPRRRAGDLAPAQVEALGRLRRAMAAHPWLVAGTGRFDTDLAQATAGRLIGKVGAEGVYCIAVPDRGWGMAFKVEDGSRRALFPAVGRVLTLLGLLTHGEAEALASHIRPVVRNHRGTEVGQVRAALDLAIARGSDL